MASEKKLYESIYFEGYKGENKVSFYFHCEKGVFLYETIDYNIPVKMTGDLEKMTDGGKWCCIPVWTFHSIGKEWKNSEGAEKEIFNLNRDTIIFEGEYLKKYKK